FKEGTQEVIYVYKLIKQIITKEGNSNETNTIEKPSSKLISQDVIKYEKKNNNVVSKNELTKTLPKTGDIEKIKYLLMGLISVIGSFGMLILRRKK
ncbi:LPXTG cell wall anchor domain-containing protein, partial [Melissococcus sp. OM08-11BH]|uniref:LPXTG cell wall anchor domain-containing protein n=3 Tax=Enterococcaceae TaxID=81852 RepID=UPI000E8D7410